MDEPLEVIIIPVELAVGVPVPAPFSNYKAKVFLDKMARMRILLDKTGLDKIALDEMAWHQFVALQYVIITVYHWVNQGSKLAYYLSFSLAHS